MSRACLVRGRWVVTGPSPSDPVLSDGAVLVEDDRIRGIGPWADLRASHPEAAVVGSDRVAVLPGLVNAHYHASAVTAVQEGVDDDLLEPWLLALRRRRPADVRLDTLLSSARLLRSGVTSVVDLPGGGGTADRLAADLAVALEAYDAAGIRVAFAPGIRERSHLVHGPGEDERFLASLPDDLRAEAAALLPGPDAAGMDEYLGIVEALWRTYRDHPRIDVWLGPPGPQWVSERSWRKIVDAAARLDTGIQTHVEESLYEKLAAVRADGRPAVIQLRDLGVLSPRCSIAHGVWLTEPEIAALAESGAALAHNPSSNLRLRAGIAPVDALLAAGVTVALGTDGNAMADDDDLLSEMRIALRLHRTPRLDGPAPTPAQALAMATTGGARLLRKEGALGRLAPDHLADLVLIDLQRVTWPWAAPEVDPRALILVRARADDVRTVLVGGEVVLEDRRPTRFDEAAAARELAAQLAATPAPREARVLERLVPRLVAHYLGWTVPDLDPYTAYNSRR